MHLFTNHLTAKFRFIGLFHRTACRGGRLCPPVCKRSLHKFEVPTQGAQSRAPLRCRTIVRRQIGIICEADSSVIHHSPLVIHQIDKSEFAAVWQIFWSCLNSYFLHSFLVGNCAMLRFCKKRLDFLTLHIILSFFCLII